MIDRALSCELTPSCLLASQVRRNTAERFYVATISLDNTVPEAAVADVIELLVSTPWLVPVTRWRRHGPDPHWIYYRLFRPYFDLYLLKLCRMTRQQFNGVESPWIYNLFV